MLIKQKLFFFDVNQAKKKKDILILLDVHDISTKLDLIFCVIYTSCNFKLCFLLYLTIIWVYGQGGLKGYNITLFYKQ